MLFQFWLEAFEAKMPGVNIEHSETVNGLRYEVIKTQEDMDRAEDFYFDVFLEGKNVLKLVI